MENSPIIQQTIDYWSTKTGLNISHEEAREMVENVAGFFTVLLEWDGMANQIEVGVE